MRIVVIVFFFLFTHHALTGQQHSPYFKSLTVEDGLSNNWVKSILKDRDGFMWFGTFNGLNRYDGRSFRIYQANGDHQLSDNIIECLAEDAQGNIWIGTFSGGLNRLEKQTETFTRFQHQLSHPGSVSGNRISAILPDGEYIWVATNAGLDRFDPGTQTFEHFIHDPYNSNTLTSGVVTCLHKDQQGHIWIGTENGLNTFDPLQGKFVRYTHAEDRATSLIHNDIKSIDSDKYGHVWVATRNNGLDQYIPESDAFRHFQPSTDDQHGINHHAILSVTGDQENLVYVATEGGGLHIYNIQEDRFYQYLPDINQSRSITSNSIHALYYDKDNGMLWIGTYNGGVNYFSKWDKPFVLIQAKEKGIQNNHITCIAEDQQGSLWIGTDGGGVNQLSADLSNVNHYARSDHSSLILQGDAVLSILCDQENQIWIGSYEGGLDVITADRKTIQHYTAGKNGLSDNSVNALYEDRRGNIWVGTMSGGINQFDARTNSFINYSADSKDATKIIDNFIYQIYEDKRGRLLVLTGKGPEVFDYKTNQFSRFLPAESAAFGVIVTLCEDSQGNLWLGSQENGLFRVDRTGVDAKRYTSLDGLPSNSICGILEDDFGNLWISTQRGLCKFEGAVHIPEKIKFHVYSKEDGLQGSEFKRGAYSRLRDGRMVFGGQSGLNIFHPTQIKHNPFVPPVSITGLKLFNKDVNFQENDWLATPIEMANEIRLTHDQSMITFEFAALSYMLAEKNQYAYRMEGFDEGWNYVGTQTNATYSNLDPGEYTFRVKAANNDGIWNEEGTGITITVIPAWWENIYFKLGLLLLAMLALIGYFRLKTMYLRRSKLELERRVKLSTIDLQTATQLSEDRQKEISRQNEVLRDQNTALEKQTHEIKRMAEEIRELSEAKIKFFSNVSHELHTPLNRMIGQLEDLLSLHNAESSHLADKHSIIYRNATQLIRMINQLMDLSKEADPALQMSKDALLQISAEAETSMLLADEWDDNRQTNLYLPSILIIEPDAAVFQLSRTRLKMSYMIEMASDGATGWWMSTEHIPDLIICDAFLPDEDGISLCERIRNDERTSHIPIILVMPRTSEAERMQHGAAIADDIISKPFQYDLLELKIKNIFFTRQKLKEQFLKGVIHVSDKMPMHEGDEQFLRKAITAVRDNLQNADFGVDEFSQYFGMSRRNVLRKIKGVTGLSINEYIRSTRLQESYNLLIKGDLNVSEVAYTVGFTDPKYFSSCFKKQFGKLPSEVKAVANN